MVVLVGMVVAFSMCSIAVMVTRLMVHMMSACCKMRVMRVARNVLEVVRVFEVVVEAGVTGVQVSLSMSYS